MAMTVARDPFARGEYVRAVSRNAAACSWCGAVKARLYTYTWSPDDRSCSKGFPFGKGFCNISCFRAFHS